MKDMIKIFFADTYALVEIIRGNKNYECYLNCILLTTKFNLIELYYYLLKDFNEDVADKYFSFYVKFLIPITFGSIKDGMKFKLKFKKEKLSYVDSLGYALALENKIKFLTGDEKFRSSNNVEFVK